MNKTKNFIKTSVLGGVSVILPVAILLIIFKWIFNLITGFIQPMTNLLMSKSHLQEIVADILVICIILGICFVVGVIVKTKVGEFIRDNLERRILGIAPGYKMIRETVMQFLGKKRSPFSSVALVQVFGEDIFMTAFVTDIHLDAMYTVFVPTGPNPTSGLVFHVNKERVHPVDVPVETALRSIISCGAGSSPIIAAFRSKNVDHNVGPDKEII